MSSAANDLWQRHSLSALGEYENGFAFNDRHWSEHGLPIVRIAQITGSQGIVDRYPGRLPDTFRIDSGDLIFSWSGTLAVVRWTGGPAWLNQHLFKVVPDPGVDRSFLFHLLQASVAEMNKRSHGSTMKHIKRGELREFFVSLPVERDEQRKLAQVLDTLDTTIHETEAIIAKLKAVKQGLLHDLLTRGIDANGELRPPQAEAPHLYKKSPLGWIPKEWDAVKLAALVSSIGQGWSPDCESRPADSGYWGILKTTAITWAGYSDQESKALPPIFKVRPDLEVKAEDILITRAGPASRVGVVAYVESSREKLMISDKMYRVRTLPTELPAYIALALSSQVVQTELGRALSGMAESQTNISQAIVKKLMVLRPLFEEQSAIVDRVRASEGRIREEDESLEKLKAFKAGLMDDLLTGRVRVTPLLAKAGSA
jgi:type I restriction enzyme, S subunit